ncbi:hypothetical protein GIB23_05925 [Pseudomonas putida]|uniref:hypothetical protein n=1 Tax=Pseudomonas putida TaxID=303 RepID=UPI001A8EBEE8|nr:hypothetical protein [Pseudomonas putida]MBO0366623.1 hypothetical protein [Pseudomonas putida]
MSVFTVYFCGTGSTAGDVTNRDYWNGELVSSLAFKDQGREFADKIVVDGPGSGNLQDDNLFVDDRDHGAAMGALLGKGWEENVAHALQVIKGNSIWQRGKRTQAEYQNLKNAGVPIPDAGSTGKWFRDRYDYGDRPTTPQELQERIIQQFRKPLIPTVVNLVGWSRGGISCHMLANAMAADPELEHIPVNILALDPVPGILNIQAPRVKLAANVKEYVGFYARDERSKGFACVVPEVQPGTRMSIFPIPGRHATLVGNASATGEGGGDALKEPGLIVRHFADSCLTRWGVQLEKGMALSDSQLRACLEALEQDDAQYLAMRKKSYTFITEGDGAERFVHHGSVGKAFSFVRGEHLDPSDGLSVTRLELNSYKALR